MPQNETSGSINIIGLQCSGIVHDTKYIFDNEIDLKFREILTRSLKSAVDKNIWVKIGSTRMHTH